MPTSSALMIGLGLFTAVGGRLLYDFLIAGRNYVTKEDCLKEQHHCPNKLNLKQIKTDVSEYKVLYSETIKIVNQIHTTLAVHTTLLKNLEKQLDKKE